jgi:electron transport complex protein RnfA
MATMVTYLIQHLILVPLGLGFLQTVAFILVIASLVQFVEMVIKKVSTPLYRALGIFLPLITTNCAIMGLCLFAVMKEYSFLQSLIYALGAGAGFTLAITLMAGIREELELANVPRSLQGAGITMVVAGIMALGFMGFAGMKF